MTLVLVVEDEFLIRMNTVEMVEEAGYAALEAANADEAIGVLDRRDDIAIVFTDINMPGSMNGLELAEAIADSWPHIRVVLTSGRFILRDEDLPDNDRFILKPFDTGQIANVLHDLAA
ncbi:MAG TPA: response regulator [Rhizomicrobium sp.]|jgi:CheY-like chemotaxis protein